MLTRESQRAQTNGISSRRSSDVPTVDVVVGVALGVFGVLLVTGVTRPPGPHGGWAAALAVLSMTVPVVWRRRAPVVVAMALLGGAVVNEVGIGAMVRCGAALPALLLTAFALGRWRRPRPGAATVIGLAALFGSAVLQAMFDPNLEPSFVILFTPVLVAFYVAGRVVRSRGSLVDRLESQTVELAEQRERTEQLAIDAERARIAAGLDDYLTGQIAQIASSAEAGRRALDGDGARPDAVQQAFAAIETRGRQTLAHMREVVGTLLSTSGPNEPQPTLAQLDDLIARDGRHVQVRIEGDRRRLSSGVEVAAYRIVERILEACAPPPAAPLDVLVRYGADALVLVAEGSDVGLADGPLALATIRARAASHGGSVVVEEAPDRWRLVVRLPVPADA